MGTARPSPFVPEKPGFPPVGDPGTGRWTVRAALDLGPPVTAVARATFARAASSQGERRAARAGLPGGVTPALSRTEAARFASRVEHAHCDTLRGTAARRASAGQARPLRRPRLPAHRPAGSVPHPLGDLRPRRDSDLMRRHDACGARRSRGMKRRVRNGATRRTPLVRGVRRGGPVDAGQLTLTVVVAECVPPCTTRSFQVPFSLSFTSELYRCFLTVVDEWSVVHLPFL